MTHYLNITALDGRKILPVDVITFGSPCQDLSVAGRREGLEGERSHLFYEAVRIIKEMREETHGKYPRFAVWENVTGAFSSSKGKDFAAVLTALVQLAEPKAPNLPVPAEGLKSGAQLEGKIYKPKTKAQMVTWYNKLHTDSAEYKMWGNGVALPMVRAVISGLAQQGAETMGSLFDGSGGFPLASVLEGITPLWSSEVEPYPIAVTRERFKFVRKEEQP